MRIIWQECKYLLRSPFLWTIAVLGMAVAVFFSMTNLDFSKSEFSVAHGFVQEHGLSFTREDAEAYTEYYLEHAADGIALRDALKKAGIEHLTAGEVESYNRGEPSEFSKKMEVLMEQDEETYWTIIASMDLLQKPMDHVEDNSIEKYDVGQWGKEQLESIPYPLSSWKRELLEDAFGRMEERAKQIAANGENHRFLPLGRSVFNNQESWYLYQFGPYGLGFIWMTSFVLAGIAAARSLGKSFMGNMQGMLYAGKPGRRLVLHKTAAVLLISMALYLGLTLLLTLIYAGTFRLDLYWNVPLASMVGWKGSVIPRFPITIGGYWLFQTGLGLGCVLLMGLLFSGFILLTKSFYTGAALSAGVPLLILGLLQTVPATQSSLLLMGSPMGFFMQAGYLLQRNFLFGILPHFEGISLLVWGGIALLAGALGFLRFRRTAL